MTLRDLTYEQRQARDAYRKQVRESRAPKAERVEKLAGPARDDVVIPPRPKPSLAQKQRVHANHNGRCWVCGAELPVTGPEVQYDHKIPRTWTGKDTDDQLGPICTVPCHAKKSAAQMSEIAHINRLRKERERTEPKPPSRLQGRGFGEDYQPFPAGRGFRS